MSLVMAVNDLPRSSLRWPSRHLRERATARAVVAFRQPTSALKLLPSALAVDAGHKAGVGGLGAIGAPACVLDGDRRPLGASALASASNEVRQSCAIKKDAMNNFLRGNLYSQKILKVLRFFTACQNAGAAWIFAGFPGPGCSNCDCRFADERRNRSAHRLFSRPRLFMRTSTPSAGFAPLSVAGLLLSSKKALTEGSF